ncbi:MAG TPA: hypothetical protein VFX89_18115, partial [Gammaproteobacteria bacterium]|nr:hypothetical protein [Gammaproteobacteria bacterium]
WTGHFPEKTRSLMRHLAKRAEALQQVYARDAEQQATVAVTTLVTSLAMNFVHRGAYFPEAPPPLPIDGREQKGAKEPVREEQPPVQPTGEAAERSG